LGGAEAPSSGKVKCYGTVSWPIGFSGGLQSSMTGYENVRFVSRIYAADFKRVLQFVLRFSDLDDYIHMPVVSYSSGMRAKLAFGLSMAIEFNYYLIDEVTAVGDSTFRKRCTEEFDKMRGRSSLIVVSHNPRTVEEYCDKVFVLNAGKLIEFKNVRNGLKYYSDL
jgi:capsular polysaccharide transport system ATP-binding protein